MTDLCLLISVPLQKYRITKRVGGGSFGDIYLGVGANGEKVRIFIDFILWCYCVGTLCCQG